MDNVNEIIIICDTPEPVEIDADLAALIAEILSGDVAGGFALPLEPSNYDDEEGELAALGAANNIYAELGPLSQSWYIPSPSYSPTSSYPSTPRSPSPIWYSDDEGEAAYDELSGIQLMVDRLAQLDEQDRAPSPAIMYAIPADPDDEEDAVCMICFTRTPRVVFPCAHLVTCVTCIRRLEHMEAMKHPEGKTPEELKCPKCTKPGIYKILGLP